jgi:ribosomal protein S2
VMVSTPVAIPAKVIEPVLSCTKKKVARAIIPYANRPGSALTTKRLTPGILNSSRYVRTPEAYC